MRRAFLELTDEQISQLKTLGDKIAGARVAKGWLSQCSFCEATGMLPTTVSAVESGHYKKATRRPNHSFQTLAKICILVGLDPIKEIPRGIWPEHVCIKESANGLGLSVKTDLGQISIQQLRLLLEALDDQHAVLMQELGESEKTIRVLTSDKQTLAAELASVSAVMLSQRELLAQLAKKNEELRKALNGNAKKR